MDHDVYTTNDAIGLVYVDLSPLFMRTADRDQENRDLAIQGWFPLYDTLRGVRGALCLVIKVKGERKKEGRKKGRKKLEKNLLIDWLENELAHVRRRPSFSLCLCCSCHYGRTVRALGLVTSMNWRTLGPFSLCMCVRVSWVPFRHSAGSARCYLIRFEDS